MHTFKQSFVDANNLRFHITQQGEGPLVLLCHGFPETAHAWRHQLAGLARAGYRAVAPDMRGFGLSDSPDEVERYSSFELVGDLVALVDALGARNAVIVGNDWGATIAWQAAQLRPDRFRGVVALGVPMMGRAPMAPSRLFPRDDSTWFYTHYFSEGGTAEREFERDIRTTLLKIYSAASGDIGPRTATTPNPFGLLPRGKGLLDILPLPEKLPDWLSEKDLDLYVKAFQHSGFRGGLNYYRNMDFNWALQAVVSDLKIGVPALYLIGERDTGLLMPGMRQIIEAIPMFVADLRGSRFIPNAGHWLPQEAPTEVNAELLGFLATLYAEP
ncbi:alpha/beta fold hydrolase [Herbaspirillum robiniae]|uniref:Alpha/beta hydrolase n=1 Tax=Herbaspirillum robiniae TaxID=2014887 RepID=A0ABX2M2M9_9BURK|nr:alpha/beta hydrolase [Herbaspirillum robiniae]NUU03523.1 alpha/beta hydrolase [Herbaspirillum robiniae]